MDELNERISKIVEESGLTKSAFGERIGVSGAFISMVCSGKSTPSERTIIGISRAFNVDEIWLRTGLGNPRPQSTLAEDIGRLVSEAMTDSTVAEREEIVKALVRMGPTGWHHLLLFLDEYQKSLDANQDK